jgi:murein DD-endopeptidase MepM/ murein hydrolase activator NlpD
LILISAVGLYAVLTNGAFPGNSSAFAAPVTGLSMPAASAAPPSYQDGALRPLTINRTIRAEQPVAPQQQEEAAQFAALSAPPPEESADAIVRQAAEPQELALPPYQVHTVVEGDTVTGIAAQYGLDPAYIIANNAEIHDADALTLGQSLIIPAGNGILHEVRLGDTLSDIAGRYNVEVGAITSFSSNGIATADAIVEAQLVYVPGGTIAPAPDLLAEAPPAAVPDTDTGAGSAAPPAGGEQVSAGPSSAEGLIWPFNGPVSSYYGSGHPLGIDLDGFNSPGAPILAATSGTVIFAGGNACCSYGLYVVIMSPGGIETLYAHLSSIAVVQGQTVSQGEVIGYIGATGYSTGTHLHFEVIDNGTRVNPISYLP